MAGLAERVSDAIASHTAKRSQRVFRRPFLAHNVLDTDSAHNQCIRDERTVAAPWNRFRTHNCAPFLPG